VGNLYTSKEYRRPFPNDLFDTDYISGSPTGTLYDCNMRLLHVFHLEYVFNTRIS